MLAVKPCVHALSHYMLSKGCLSVSVCGHLKKKKKHLKLFHPINLVTRCVFMCVFVCASLSASMMVFVQTLSTRCTYRHTEIKVTYHHIKRSPVG